MRANGRLVKASASAKPRESRKERALQTRRRMLHAAYRLFCSKGYVATTMEAIADEAGVAVQTLYFTFHTKGAILSETLAAAINGFEHWKGPLKEPFDAAETPKKLPWWPAFDAEPDAHRALGILVEAGADILWRAGALASAVRGSGDPDAIEVFEIGERRRVDSYREFVRVLSRKKGGLKPRLSLARATDIFVVLFSGPVYNDLHTGRGWSHGECRRFLLEVLTQQLLRP